MTKGDDWSGDLGHLLKIEKKGGYVDYIRDRWSDEDVLKVFHHARKLEARKWQKKMRDKVEEIKDKIFAIGKKHNPENSSLTDDEGYEGLFINYNEVAELR